MLLRYIYILLGTISLVLGILGFFVPGLPRTPFLLLTAYLYAKGSPRLHKMIMDNKMIGPYVRKVNKGLSWKATLVSIASMWAMICFTIFFVFKGNLTMQWVMVGLGIIGTVCQYIVLMRRSKVKEEELIVEKDISGDEPNVLE